MKLTILKKELSKIEGQMKFDKLKVLTDKLKVKNSKYFKEKDYGRKQIIRMEIQILDLRIKIERIKRK
ncbi:MAG: hypothetical protein IPN14_10105 [Bacteroidetes bacterium]|nr:hypothetical protein [Bacteroidota bacterium]